VLRWPVVDLDGTLAHTRPLVVAAYAAVGIDMPFEAWGHPVHDWLPKAIADCGAALNEHEIHNAKNEVYMTLIRTHGVNELSPAAFVRQLHAQGQPFMVLTSASAMAADAILHALELKPNAVISYVERRHKAKFLGELAETGLYIDDDRTTVARVRDQTGWRVVHYTNQRVEDLMNEWNAV
jgi:FMN phosphatase YigB (HAD superfamily)